MLRADGSIWGWGYNEQGQIGDGTNVTKTGPVPSLANSGFTSVKAGVFHSLALKEDGTAWAWGYNHYGRLGDGHTDRSLESSASDSDRQRRGDLAVVPDIALPAQVMEEHGVGKQQWGQLSIGTNTNSPVPVRSLVDCGFRSMYGASCIATTFGTAQSIHDRRDYCANRDVRKEELTRSGMPVEERFCRPPASAIQVWSYLVVACHRVHTCYMWNIENGMRQTIRLMAE